ncbi:RdgB/HAM1 family non-canonical purine NTP pyrophosphatase [Prosthecobacter dejongeii]|uniref:dITP/XTP pyrophosphatase n=1 Tax=Prosthecobacter dejongeii TaxID=48465 RepID=A0A7W7YK82_9BACT|nr:RdgB/HAM1 family non-canonical purine NTP pyrophosphatase [Prosthecobacter dejongeii]MBB5037750.1 XTP/dITP diphosphohydrolase [Prosthecobacter dejongeii]
MPQLLLATANAHKTQEVSAMLGTEWQVEDLRSIPGMVMPEETGTTFEANAIIKAQAASAARPGLLVLADDSGLEVDILNKEPGVRSARFAGENATDEDNRRALKERLRRVSTNPGQIFPARFRCCLALVRDGEVLHVTHGIIEGRVSTIERGRGGFGYDAMFTPEDYSQTFGELPAEVKNQLSHRAHALESMQKWLQSSPEALMAYAQSALQG